MRQVRIRGFLHYVLQSPCSRNDVLVKYWNIFCSMQHFNPVQFLKDHSILNYIHSEANIPQIPFPHKVIWVNSHSITNCIQLSPSTNEITTFGKYIFLLLLVPLHLTSALESWGSKELDSYVQKIWKRGKKSTRCHPIKQ